MTETGCHGGEPRLPFVLQFAMLNGQEFGCERRGVKRMTRIKDGSSTDVTDIDTSSPTV
jgi:hypothetical protein